MRYRSAVLLVAAALGVLGSFARAAALQTIPGRRIRGFSASPRLEPENRVDPRAAALSQRLRAQCRWGLDLNWTIDYPRSDRHLLEGVRRLTRIDTRSVEQIVDLDGTDDVYNWPMMYAVEVGHWALPDDQAAQLREFLLRGGFLMVDDFHGDEPYHNVFSEWQVFLASMTKVFPDRPIVDLENSNPIFHTIYDLDDRFQVAGWQWYCSGRTYEAGETGKTPHWRAIFDDKGRVMVAICHNMDLGDAWEWSDDPRYPEKWASLAYRIAMNYFIYDLTH